MRDVTSAEAKQWTELAHKHGSEYVRRGELKGRLIGRRWRFRREDLDAFFDAAPAHWDFGGKRSNEE